MRNLVMDVDTGEDDALAILLALNLGLSLRLVIGSHGNTSVENSTRNSAAVLQLAGARQVQVVRGSGSALRPHAHCKRGVSAGRFVGRNGLCELKIPDPREIPIETPREEDLGEFLAEKLARLAPVTYVVTGPATNLARICEAAGGRAGDLIEEVYMMGGALDGPGNTGPVNPASGRPYSEFNFYCDPAAIATVLGSGLPIKLVTLDETSRLNIEHSYFSALTGQGASGEFACALMSSFFRTYGISRRRDFELNDPATVMAAAGWGDFAPARCRVVLDGLELGRLVRDESGSEIELFACGAAGPEDLAKKILSTLGCRPN